MNLTKWNNFYSNNEYSFLSPVSQAFVSLFDENIVSCNEQLFGFHSPMNQKLLLSKVLMPNFEINMGLANRIYIFSKLYGFNHDILYSEINSYILETDVNDEQYPTKKLIAFLKIKYNESRILKIFFNHKIEAQELEDLDLMIKKALSKHTEQEVLNILPEKPKHYGELHDALSIALSNFTAPNITLKQREDIVKLDGAKILNNLTIKVPQTHYDLVKLGNQLNFCIGNGTYTTKVNEGKISIVSIFKDGSPLFGIEFNRYAIKQARGFGNSVLSADLLGALEDILIKEPIVPEDFIKIEKHPFIYGYKYNNNDLFMMLKGGSIYIYHEISHEIYDGLVKSETKGNYFHNFIRPIKNFTKRDSVA